LTVRVAGLRLMPAGKFSVEPVRLVPVRVTDTLFPCTPDSGLMEVSVGVGGTTVNVKTLLFPLVALLTVMLCTKGCAPGARTVPVKIAVIVVSLTTETEEAVTPTGAFNVNVPPSR